MNRPFLLLAVERSGVRLLRLYLDYHSRLSVPPPSALVRVLGPLEGRYGDLQWDVNFLRLAEDACRLVRLTPHPWPRDVDPGEVFQRARERSLFGIVMAIHEIVAGARRPGLLLIPPDLAFARRLGAPCIFLARDPREVARSAWSSPYGWYHPGLVAQAWEAGAEAALALRAHVVRFEDLLAEPEVQLRAVCEYLQEAFEPGMLDAPKGAEANALAAWTLKLPKPRQTEVARIEALAERGMRNFSYSLHSTENERRQLREVTRTRKCLWILLDSARRVVVESEGWQRDPSFPARLARLGFIAWLRLRAAMRTPRQASVLQAKKVQA
ncbi:MAG: hypothetical protein ACYCW6_03110 [Candidatus Xenobia bacterium]